MRSNVSGPLALAALLAAAASAPATAQYSVQTLTLPGKQIKYQMHDKLGPVPMQLGAEGPHYVARFEPVDEGDFIHGRLGTYKWYAYVLDFPAPGTADEATPTTGEPKPMSKEEAEAAARKAMLEKSRARSFEDWVTDKDPGKSGSRRFVVKAKEKKGSSKRPGYKWWEYADSQPVNVGGRDEELIWYKVACVYDLGDREVALLVVLPVKSGDKPDSKYMTIANRICTSLVFEESEAGDEDTDARRDRYADTPERQEALKRLKDNIGDLKNWDYFTSPHYIFTYSWHKDKPQKKKESLSFARDMEARLEEIREKYEEYYPPHENVGNAYSVIRICYDLEDFRKYGSTQYGVVGWFSPGSKELVIYYDQQRVFLQDDDEMLAVCYHEAWHQYADQYFPGVELHRWYDEGLAEYFGTYRKKGKRWSHTYHKGRLEALDRQDKEGNLIPTAEIVTWDRAKFYGPRAADHYAQGYAMVDFLVRGKDVLGKRWNDRWSEILPIYTKVCLEQKSAKKAVEAAFEGVDFAELETAWKTWFQRGDIKRS